MKVALCECCNYTEMFPDSDAGTNVETNEGVPAKYQCLTCGAYFCTLCANHHRDFFKLYKHQLKELSVWSLQDKPAAEK